MQTIYFDESGFTGERLMDETQPTFVYASVALDPSDATQLQQEVFRRFRIGGTELKGKNWFCRKFSLALNVGYDQSLISSGRRHERGSDQGQLQGPISSRILS